MTTSTLTSMLESADRLRDSLKDLHVQSSRELIVALKERLGRLDEEGLGHREETLQGQRGQVHRFGIPGSTLPPGATQCPQALCKRFAALEFMAAGTAFTTFIMHYGLVAGKYQYEMCACSAGSMQIGFCGPMNMFLWDDKKGVGDFPFSVAYDGSKSQLLNVSATPAGWKWTTGDVVSVTFDLDEGVVSFYQNGKFVVACQLPTVKSLMSAGIQHSDRDIEMCYFPAISLGPWEQCHMNMGGFPFFYPIPGFRAIDDGAILEQLWVPRLGVLGAIPPHLSKYRHIIESMALQKVVENSETNFQSFVACTVNYTMALYKASPEGAYEYIDVLRRSLPEDMFGGLASIFITKCCVFSGYSLFSLPFPDFSDSFLISRGYGAGRKRRSDEPKLMLSFLEFVFEKVPESLQYWINSPNLPNDIMNLSHVKTPNDRDLSDLYPEASAEDALTDDGMRRLRERQSVVAEELKQDELARNRIFMKIVSHPVLRAHLATLLHRLVTELKDAQRGTQAKRITVPGYSEQAAARLYFQVITALSEKCVGEDDKAIAECICPLSVLRMPTEYPNFSGTPHDVLLKSDHRADFTNVPEIAPGSPESTLFLACELYYVSVKAWMVRSFSNIMNLSAARKTYLRLLAAGKTSQAELRLMRERLAEDLRILSWDLSSIYRVGLQPHLASFASAVFKMVRYYVEHGYSQFIPVMFVESATDVVHYVRKTYPRYVELFESRPEISLFFMVHFRSKIIRYQPTREYIMMTVGGLVGINEVHRRQALYIIENHLDIMRHFITQVFDQFSNTMAWTLVVNMLSNFNCGNGFVVLGTEADDFAAFFGDPIPASPEDIEAYARLNKTQIDFFEDASAWQHEGPDSSPLSFLKNAITHGNWCVTELSSFLSGTNENETVTTEVRSKRQRGASVFDYTVKVLHILEGILHTGFNFFFNTTDDNAGTVPSHNATPISAASKTMLVAELVGQCLGRFCGENTALKRVCELDMPGLDKLQCTSMAAPIIGLLFNMMGPRPEEIVGMVKHLGTTEAIAKYRAYVDNADSNALPKALLTYVDSLVKENIFFRFLACPRVDWDHNRVRYILTHFDWADVCRKSRHASNVRLLRFLPLAAIAYEALADERDRIQEIIRLHPRASCGGDCTTLVDGDEDDEEGSVCAICYATPLEVVFEPCGHSSCRSCIERHQISDRRCFFCKAWVKSVKSLKE